MDQPDRSTFPFEITEMEPEQTAEIRSMYAASKMDVIDYVVVGPKKYKLRRKYVQIANDIYNMQTRPSDVFVMSMPRSGTTWTQELVWLIANDLDFTTAKSITQTDRYYWLEKKTLFGEEWQRLFVKCAADQEKALQTVERLSVPLRDVLASLPSPRFLKTHLPISLLPPSLLDNSKAVYIARDPRDVAVSNYHLAKTYKSNITASFKDFWNVYRKGLHGNTPLFEHVKEAWAMRHHPNMLFLFYEELSQDMPSSARRVANFLGKDITPEQMNRLCEHLSFNNFQNNESVNLQSFRKAGIFSDTPFIRKGKVGGWRDYFDEEMTLEAERWIQDNLNDTDLRYPHM